MIVPLDVKEMADRLKVKPSWIYRKVNEGGDDPLPYFRFGKYLRFDEKAVFEWAKRQAEKSIR